MFPVSSQPHLLQALAFVTKVTIKSTKDRADISEHEPCHLMMYQKLLPCHKVPIESLKLWDWPYSPELL